MDQFGLMCGRILLVCSNEQKCHSEEDSAFCTVLRSIEQSLAQRNYSVQFLSVGQNPRDDRQRLNAMLAHDEVKGVLSIGSCLEPYSDLFIKTSVVTTCSFYPQAFPWVGNDVSLVSRESVRHLISNGHTRIAMICGSWIDGDAFAAFARGFMDAMHDGGQKPDRSLMVHAYAGESLEELAVNILSRSYGPSGIFCENWRVCNAVVKAATKLGLKIPDDLSIVGYGQNVCDINEPVPITAFVPETAKVGEQAVELLVKMIGDYANGASNIAVESVKVAGRLFERGSVRCLEPALGEERGR
jgi:DNA-binding LacI/PurR family transcriptional regulator